LPINTWLSVTGPILQAGLLQGIGRTGDLAVLLREDIR